MQETSYPKISLIISSYNQLKRLRFSLQSALKQKYSGEYEIIVADDNSTDDTKVYLDNAQKHTNIKVSYNPFSIKGLYTLADNWNQAAKIATGKRLIFTNGDILLSKGFIEAHADSNMQSSIIFGPALQTTEKSVQYIDTCTTLKDLLKNIEEHDSLGPDLHDDKSAMTYNQEFTPFHPWGYNFSIPKDIFDAAKGFPPLRVYGGEELYLCLRAQYISKCSIKSNKNALGIHLWHPRVNDLNKTTKDEYSL